MKVYDIEKEHCLDKLILANTSVGITSQLLPNAGGAYKFTEFAQSHSIDVGDLFPTHTIYVTIGWNKNDDIFDKYETWDARKTPSNKPFNMQHKPREIIGHIIDSFGYTLDNDIIPDDISHDELPEQYHLVTQSVIYKSTDHDHRDEELKKEREQLVADILNGLWYVSMECVFDDFDYGFIGKDNSHSIVQRNESTAFLTKHLRAYGGSGAYGESKLGRILRKLTFIGNGLVKNPANPNSVFLLNQSNIANFHGYGNIVDDKQGINFISATYAKGDNLMSDTMLDEYKSKVNDLEKSLAEAHQKLRDMDEQTVKAKLNAKDTEISARDTQITQIQEKLDSIIASYNDVEKTNKELEKTVGETREALTKAQSELESIRAEARNTDRVSTLINEGVTKEEAQNAVAKFGDLDDEKFTEIVAMYKKIVAKGEASHTDSHVNSEAKGEEEDGEEIAAEENLESAEEDEKDADLASASEDTRTEQNEMLVALAKDISKYMRGEEKSE